MNSSDKSEPCASCEFEDNLAILRQIFFFSAMPLEILKVFAYLCTRETFKAGDELFQQGDDDGQAIYLLSGKARLYRKDETGEWVVQDLEKEHFVGGLALLGNTRRLFSLRALTDVMCLILTREKFITAMKPFQDQMPKVYNTLVGRIVGWEERFLLQRDEKCPVCKERVGVSLI